MAPLRVSVGISICLSLFSVLVMWLFISILYVFPCVSFYSFLYFMSSRLFLFIGKASLTRFVVD